jgi:hypothetical protein
MTFIFLIFHQVMSVSGHRRGVIVKFPDKNGMQLPGLWKSVSLGVTQARPVFAYHPTAVDTEEANLVELGMVKLPLAHTSKVRHGFALVHQAQVTCNCTDPADPAQVMPLKHTLEQVFHSQPGEAAGGCRTESRR